MNDDDKRLMAQARVDLMMESARKRLGPTSYIPASVLIAFTETVMQLIDLETRITNLEQNRR
jgi:hypothetical protein